MVTLGNADALGNRERIRDLQVENDGLQQQITQQENNPLGQIFQMIGLGGDGGDLEQLQGQLQNNMDEIDGLGGNGQYFSDGGSGVQGGAQPTNAGGGGVAPGQGAGGMAPGQGAGGLQGGGSGAGGLAVHTRVNPDGTSETVTTPAGQPGPWKGDPFAVDSDGDGKMTLLGDDKGKVQIDDGTGNGPINVNKWKDDMLFEDKNKDGKFQADEIQSTKDPEAIKKSGFDKNNDGKLDEAEAKAGNLKFVSYDDNGKEQVRGFGEEGPGGKPGIKTFGYNLNKPGQTGTDGIQEKGRSTAEFTNGKTADTINFDFVPKKSQAS